MLQKLRKFFSDERVSVFVFVAAVISRLLNQLYFFRTGVDRSLQLVGARNLLQGHGITVNHVLSENLSQPVYTPIVGWPPGYPAIVSLFAFVFHLEVTIAAILFDMVCAFIFIYYSRKILVLLGCPPAPVNFYTLVLGFFTYDFWQAAAPDKNALAFYMAAFYMTLVFINDENKTPRLALVIALLNFMPPFLRYMFIPIALVLPAYLLLYGKKTNNRRIFRGALITSVTTLLCLAGLLIFQQTYTGSAAYVNEEGKGFFPENLLRFYPIVVAAFVNLTFIYSAINNFGLGSYGQFSSVTWWLNLILFLSLIFGLIKFVLRKAWRSFSITDHFIYIGGAVSLSILALLTTLSIYYAPLNHSGNNWTFVYEGRYMAFVLVFLQMLTFALFFTDRYRIKVGWVRSLIFIFLILMGLETIHGIYFSAKALITDRGSFHSDKDYTAKRQFIKELINGEDTTQDLVFTSRETSFVNIASLEGGKALYGYDSSKMVSSARKFVLIRMVKNLDTINHSNDPCWTRIKTIGNLTFLRYQCR